LTSYLNLPPRYPPPRADVLASRTSQTRNLYADSGLFLRHSLGPREIEVLFSRHQGSGRNRRSSTQRELSYPKLEKDRGTTSIIDDSRPGSKERCEGVANNAAIRDTKTCRGIVGLLDIPRAISWFAGGPSSPQIRRHLRRKLRSWIRKAPRPLLGDFRSGSWCPENAWKWEAGVSRGKVLNDWPG